MKKIILVLLLLTSCTGSEPSLDTKIEIKAIDAKIFEFEKMLEMVKTQDITKEMIPINQQKIETLEKRILVLKARRAKLTED